MFDPKPQSGAGQYRDRVLVQQPAKTTAADGQVLLTWTTYGSFWSRVEPTGGSEETEHRRQQAEQQFKVTFRSSPETRGITTQMRLRLADGRLLGLVAYRDVGSVRREVEVIASQSQQ